MRIYYSLRLFAGVVVVGLFSLTPTSAAAAESYDNCNGVITSLPATISTQGVWCLKKNLVHAASTGAAITIAANNVTVDCNHFNVDAAAGAAGSDGIAGNVLNATIRNCGIRGFRSGIHLDGGGHLVEENYLDRNRLWGVRAMGSNNRVVGNRVFNTLGSADGANSTTGILANGDVIDNLVSGLVSGSGSFVYGINALSGEVSGNTVRGFMLASGKSARAIYPRGAGMKMRSNHVISAHSNAQQVGTVSGSGIYSASGRFCGDNTVAGFTTNVSGGCKPFGGPGNTGG